MLARTSWRGGFALFAFLGTVVACGGPADDELLGDDPAANDVSDPGVQELTGVTGFVTRRGGDFYENGKVWHPVGVSYAYPHYSQPYYAHSTWDWVTLWDAPEFPNIHAKEEIEADFALMQQKKINEFRLYPPQTYPADLKDPANDPSPARSYCTRLNQVLDMAGKHGLRVTMVLPFNRTGTGGTYGVAGSQAKADLFMAYPIRVIDECGLAKRPEILGYDVDGEGEVESPSEPEFFDRGQPEAVGLWNEWLTERYGSPAKAQARWGETLRRECTDIAKGSTGRPLASGCPDLDVWDSGCKAHGPRVCPPRLEQTTSSKGEIAQKWGADSNAKRAFVRFTDWVMNKRFQRVREILAKHDSKHLLAQDSILQDGYCSTAIFLRREQTKYLDYSGVHVYHHQYTKGTWDRSTFGEGETFDKLKSTAAAIAWMNPDRRPVTIGEVGVNVLPCETPKDGKPIPFCIHGSVADREAVQKEYVPFENAIFATGGAVGYRWWWWRGQRPMGAAADPKNAKARDGEVSDYGVTTPAGKARPILDEFGPSKRAYEAMDAIPTSQAIKYTFDASASCSAYILDKPGRDAAIVAVVTKKPFRALTQCTGRDTSNAPTTGLDGKPYFSACTDPERCSPLVCLDAMFETIQVLDADGTWADARDGKTVTVAKGTPVKMRVSVGNTGESAWAASASTGEARIAISGSGVTNARAKIPATVASFDSTQVIEFSPVSALNAPTTLRLKMVAEKRAFFGEEVSVSLAVK